MAVDKDRPIGLIVLGVIVAGILLVGGWYLFLGPASDRRPPEVPAAALPPEQEAAQQAAGEANITPAGEAGNAATTDEIPVQSAGESNLGDAGAGN